MILSEHHICDMKFSLIVFMWFSVLEPHAPYDVPFKSIQQDFEEFLHQAVAFPRLQLDNTVRTGGTASGNFN